MKQEIWYTIHFEDAGTGENFDDGVYASIDELISSSAFDYPGYGSQTIKEIDRATALEMWTLIQKNTRSLSRNGSEKLPNTFSIKNPAGNCFRKNTAKNSYTGDPPDLS